MTVRFRFAFGRRATRAGFTEVEENWPGLVQQSEHARATPGGSDSGGRRDAAGETPMQPRSPLD